MHGANYSKCVICHQSITNITHIFDEDLKTGVCLSCHVQGKERRNHNRRCNYQIIGPIDSYTISGDWTIREELVLLHKLVHEGFGNWGTLAASLPNRTPRECELHYMQVSHFQLELVPVRAGGLRGNREGGRGHDAV